MEIPFPFESLLLFGWLGIMLLVGIVFRAKIKFLQYFLFPSCLIGGVLGLILTSTGVINLKVSLLETFAYHFFNISFISVGLTFSSNQEKTSSGRREFLNGPVWMALVEGVTFPLQAVLGGLLVILFGIFGLKLFPTFAFLVPLGFTEGPGQALSVGKVWEGFGFEHAATIGLTFAAIGFLFAFFVGVPLTNWGIRKGYSALGKKALPQDFLRGIISKDKGKDSAGEQTMHSGNVDTLAFQTALVGLVYILTYVFIKYFGKILPADASKILWGFFFFFGMGIALILKWLMGKVGIGHLVDPGVQRRITGWAVDFLIVATVMAVQMVVVWKYILPISVIAISNGVLTTLVVVYLGRRIESYNLERTAAIYGTVTGTVSCGLLLLRIVDPDFKTPVAIDIALMNVIVVPIIGGCMVLVNAPVWWDWSVALTVLVFFSIMVVCLILIRVLKLWGSPKF